MNLPDVNWVKRGFTFDDEYKLRQKYENKIFRHKSTGGLFRVDNLNYHDGCYYIGIYTYYEFDLLFDLIGECKYTKNEINAMEMEVKNNAN